MICDEEPTLIEELRATTLLTRTVPLFVRETCGQAAEQLGQLEAIVRDLAASNPESAEDRQSGRLWRVWLAAQEWVAEHPAPEGSET